MLTRKTLVATLVAAYLCSGSAFAAGIPLHLKNARASACPTAVEKPGAAAQNVSHLWSENAGSAGQTTGETAGHPDLMNQEKKGATAADAKTKGAAAPLAKVQNGLLLPAVKQGSSAGQ